VSARPLYHIILYEHDPAGRLPLRRVPPATSEPYVLPPPHPSQYLHTRSGKHVVFGQVIEGYSVVKAMEAIGSPSGATALPVLVKDCGVLGA
jgi:cyclophilin family peptidyl-prolyl cis-trans isomerase